MSRNAEKLAEKIEAMLKPDFVGCNVKLKPVIRTDTVDAVMYVTTRHPVKGLSTLEHSLGH